MANISEFDFVMQVIYKISGSLIKVEASYYKYYDILSQV